MTGKKCYGGYLVHYQSMKESSTQACQLPQTISLVSFCKIGSLGIAPTRNCTHFLKIGFWSTGAGFFPYYIHQGNKSDKERQKLSFMHI